MKYIGRWPIRKNWLDALHKSTVYALSEDDSLKLFIACITKPRFLNDLQHIDLKREWKLRSIQNRISEIYFLL